MTGGILSASTPVFADETASSIVRGAKLYDKWYKVIGAKAPKMSQAAYPTSKAKAKKPKDNWRFKECHGWDYKGVDGAYKTGSHNTGIRGINAMAGADTGKIVYEGGRMPVAQRFSASPVAFDGKFLMPGVDGDVFVIRAGPEFEVLSTNSLGEGIWANPAISNGRIYIRTLEHLWAIEQLD